MDADLWHSVGLSLRIAGVATAVALAVAIPLAYFNGRHVYRFRSVVDAILVLPLVLPPTVVGYLIIICLGSHGLIGQWLNRWWSYSVMFRFEGAVLAAATVALPLLYLPARSAFASIDREMEDIARLMGANRFQVFWHVSLPLARRGVAAGLMLAFARALGEFGATLMVFGLRPGQSTLPVSIYLNYDQGNMPAALPAVLVLCGLSIAMTLLYNRSTFGRRE